MSAKDDLLFRASKKIAQLTKVIFYLNTKVEDHNFHIKDLQDAYEEEIANILKDARDRISGFESQIAQCEAHEKSEKNAHEIEIENGRKLLCEIKSLRESDVLNHKMAIAE